MSNTTTTNTTNAKLEKIVNAFGYEWRVQDARHYASVNKNFPVVAYAVPHDPETGEPVLVVKIGRVTREYSYTPSFPIHLSKYNGKLSAGDPGTYSAPAFTDKAIDQLTEALAPEIAEFAIPLTRTERFDQFLSSQTAYLMGDLKRSIDNAVGYRFTSDPSGDLSTHNRTPEERERVKQRLLDILDELRTEINNGEVGA